MGAHVPPRHGFILTVNPANVEEVCRRFADVGITAAAIGEVNGTGRLSVRYLAGRHRSSISTGTASWGIFSDGGGMPVTVGLGAASPDAKILSTVRAVGREVDLILFSPPPGTAGTFGDAVTVVEAAEPQIALIEALYAGRIDAAVRGHSPPRVIHPESPQAGCRRRSSGTDCPPRDR